MNVFTFVFGIASAEDAIQIAQHQQQHCSDGVDEMRKELLKTTKQLNVNATLIDVTISPDALFHLLGSSLYLSRINRSPNENLDIGFMLTEN